MKFPFRDGTRTIYPHSVGIVDGFCKVICMLAIVAFCKELELTHDELDDPVLSATLASFASINCSYSHFTHPGHHFLHSLRCLAFNVQLFIVVQVFSSGVVQVVPLYYSFLLCSGFLNFVSICFNVSCLLYILSSTCFAKTITTKKWDLSLRRSWRHRL